MRAARGGLESKRKGPEPAPRACYVTAALLVVAGRSAVGGLGGRFIEHRIELVEVGDFSVRSGAAGAVGDYPHRRGLVHAQAQPEGIIVFDLGLQLALRIENEGQRRPV